MILLKLKSSYRSSSVYLQAQQLSFPYLKRNIVDVLALPSAFDAFDCWIII